MNNTYIFIGILIIAAVTIALRALPFLVFSGKRKAPQFITKLSSLLPYAVMGMLVVFCLKDISFTSVGTFLPELISAALVAAVHLWKHNTILSIVAGTVCYMLLVQLVFV
ncbi:MAG: AzlD domain-containing protein [Parasporobacterium sp.]|nr:AzlD domain-containing protein [Parasporobacterium sp.]